MDLGLRIADNTVGRTVRSDPKSAEQGSAERQRGRLVENTPFVEEVVGGSRQRDVLGSLSWLITAKSLSK